MASDAKKKVYCRDCGGAGHGDQRFCLTCSGSGYIVVPADHPQMPYVIRSFRGNSYVTKTPPATDIAEPCAEFNAACSPAIMGVWG